MANATVLSGNVAAVANIASIRNGVLGSSSVPMTIDPATPPQEMCVLSVTKPFGQKKFSGLMNQRCMFMFVVHQALYKGAAIDVSSLRWRGGWDVTTSVPHADLYDVDHWNGYAMEHPGKLPLLVDMDRLRREGRVVPIDEGNSTAQDVDGLEIGVVRMDLNFGESFKSMVRSKMELGGFVHEALRPSRIVSGIVSSLKPRGEYGAIHMRIEEDLRQAPKRWNERVTAPMALDAIRRSRAVTECLEQTGATDIYVAVAMDDVQDPGDRALLRSGADGPWPGTRLVHDYAAKEAAVLPRFGNNSNVVSALIDFEICKTASAFVAGNMDQSSFSWFIADGRLHKSAQSMGRDSCRALSFDYKSNKTYPEIERKKHNNPDPKWEARRIHTSSLWTLGHMIIQKQKVLGSLYK